MRAKHKRCLSLGAQLNLDHSPAVLRLRSRAAVGGCCRARLPPLLPGCSCLTRSPAGRRKLLPGAHSIIGQAGRVYEAAAEGGARASAAIFRLGFSRFLGPFCACLPALLPSVCLPHCSPPINCRCGAQRLGSHELHGPCALTAHICCSRLRGQAVGPFRECFRGPPPGLRFGLHGQLFSTNCIKIAAIKRRFGPLCSLSSGEPSSHHEPPFPLFIVVCFLFSKAYYIGCKQQQKCHKKARIVICLRAKKDSWCWFNQ